MTGSSEGRSTKIFWIVVVSVFVSACVIALIFLGAGLAARFFGRPDGTPDPISNTQEQVIEALKAIAVPVVGLIGAGIGFYYGSSRLKRNGTGR